MERLTCLFCLNVIFFFSLHVKAQVTLDSTQLKVDTVAANLDIPWEIKWGPDDKIWTTERFGRISRIDPVTGSQDVVLDHSSSVFQTSETGMLGMLLHPDFATHPHVFVVYTFGSSTAIFERLARFTYDGTSLVNELILLDSIPGSFNHAGSRLLMLPDTTLLMTTGDALDKPSAQNPGALSGKTLRLNLDGSIPADNPTAGSYIYSLGHRNPQGLLLHPNGKIYSSEHGPSNDDEFQIIMPGRNYGWPDVEGFCDQPAEITFCQANNVAEPLFAWTPTIAPSDLVWFTGNSIPEWHNKVLMAVLKNMEVVAIELDAGGNQVISQKHYLQNQFGRLRDILVAPDGSIYLATNGPSPTNANPFSHYILSLKAYNPSGIKETEKPSLELFPNPVEDVLSVKGLLGKSIEFSILDNQGKLLKKGSGKAERNTLILEVASLPDGMYVLHLQAGPNSWQEKFVKR